MKNENMMLLSVAILVFLAGISFGIGVSAFVFLESIKDWQTIIAGIMSIVAAIMTVTVIIYQTRSSVSGIREQIALQKSLEDEVRKRKQLSCRAILPYDLSEIVTFCKSYSEFISQIAADARDGMPKIPPNFNDERIPERVIANMQYAVEHFEADVADACAQILSEYQLFMARMRKSIKPLVDRRAYPASSLYVENQIESALVCIVMMQILCNKLFPFSRRDDETVRKEIIGDEVNNAIINLGFSDYVSERVTDDLRRWALRRAW